MAIIGKTRAQIVSDLLTDWTARMVAAGFSSFNANNSLWCVEFATALAVDLEAHESNAEALATEMVTETASDDTVTRAAAVEGITAKGASPGAFSVSITGAAGATGGTTIQPGGRKLVSKTGKLYSPPASFVMPQSATSVTVTVTADEVGSASDLALGDVLTWTAAPAGIDTTATVASGLATLGADADGTDDLRAAIIAWRRGRPASGNPADWCKRAEQIAAVHRAYCYPNLKPHFSGGFDAYANTDLDTPGCVTMVVLGAPQGDSPSYSVIGGTQGVEPAAVRGYFLGTYDANGNASYGNSPQYPGTMDPADIAIIAPYLYAIDVTITLTLDGKNAYPWAISSPMTVVAGSTTTSLIVSGNQTAKAGMRALVNVGTSHIRGGYQLVTLPPGPSFGGGNTTFDLTQTPLNYAPTAATSVYAAPGNWELYRAAMFALFDSLGPGNVPAATSVAPAAGYTRRRRWPPEAFVGPSSLPLTKLIEVATSVPGVVDAAVTLPVADVAPGPKTLITLGYLLPQ